MIFQEFQDARPSASPRTSRSAGCRSAGASSSRGAGCEGAPRRSRTDGRDLDLDAPVGSLRIGERQLVEIARALSDEAKVLILDEPTAALSHRRSRRCFVYLRAYATAASRSSTSRTALTRWTELADRVQVLRDGDVAIVGDDHGLRPAGPRLGDDRPHGRRRRAPGAAGLGARRRAGDRVQGREHRARVRRCLAVRPAGRDRRGLRPARLGIRRARRLGLRLRKLTAGELLLRGRAVSHDGPARAIRRGVGFVPADRKAEAIFPVRPVVREHLGALLAAPLARPHLIRRRPRRAPTRTGTRSSDSLAQRPYAADHHALGRNQQKVVLGRWLECGTPVLVMVEPTRGVDVGARAELYRSMRGLAATGSRS